jgi:hypothetical protein
MDSIKQKLTSFKPKNAYLWFINTIEHHSLTVLIVIAGVLVGFSLFSVSSLTRHAASSVTEGDAPSPLASLNINPETEQTLLALGQDEDVSISSNIATYRRSAFSNATEESQWVIEAADALESYFTQNDFYPTENQIVAVLGLSGVAGSDSEGRAVNSSGSDYRYSAERCDNGQCGGFFLTAQVGSSIYQLGETDSIKRDWVNSTAQALDALSKSTGSRLYPTESNFIADMKSFYSETLNDTFVTADPAGVDVNDDESDYGYRGIDCSSAGCSSFVLRTTFKDGALYFQQSQ